MSMTKEELMTTDEVARYLRLHPRTVTNMAERGELLASKVGRHWRFRKSDVDAYVDRQRPKKDQ